MSAPECGLLCGEGPLTLAFGQVGSGWTLQFGLTLSRLTKDRPSLGFSRAGQRREAVEEVSSFPPFSSSFWSSSFLFRKLVSGLWASLSPLERALGAPEQACRPGFEQGCHPRQCGHSEPANACGRALLCAGGWRAEPCFCLPESSSTCPPHPGVAAALVSRHGQPTSLCEAPLQPAASPIPSQISAGSQDPSVCIFSFFFLCLTPRDNFFSFRGKQLPARRGGARL